MSRSSDEDGTELLEAVLVALRAEGRRFELVDDPLPTLRFGHEGRSGRWFAYVRVDPEDRVVACYSVFPADAPPERRAAVCECVARINSGLAVGCFEIDVADGEILVRTSIAARGAALPSELVHVMIEDGLLLMDTYFAAVQAVLEGREPAEAVGLVEG